MIHLSSHYKRLKMRFLKMALLAVFVSIFSCRLLKFVKTGDNMFTVLNGQEVGVVDSVEDAQSYAVEARRNVASRVIIWFWWRAKSKPSGRKCYGAE